MNSVSTKRHPLKSVWKGMKQRCNYKKSISFKNYGARGIKVCERWDSFANFLADMGPSWRPGLTLHRKNSVLGYSPDNVVWETWDTQNNNSRHNRVITFAGVSKTASQWARERGFSLQTLCSRFRYGWSVERALTTPKLRQGKA